MKILQIVESTMGWHAKYKDNDELDPVICWAIIEDEGFISVAGLVNADREGLIPADDVSNFECYCIPQDDVVFE